MEKTRLKSNIILVDADYLDSVAGDIISNVGRMLGRSIPKADLAHWLVCAALDGGLTQGNHEVQVVMVRSAKSQRLTNFVPSYLGKEVDGQAFRDPYLGEFLMSCIVEEDINHGEPLLVQCLETILSEEQVKWITVAPNMARYGTAILRCLEEGKGKQVTLLTMQPQEETKCAEHVVLGFSLMQAMGVRADEF